MEPLKEEEGNTLISPLNVPSNAPSYTPPSSTHPLNLSYAHILSTPSQHILSTHPINTSGNEDGYDVSVHEMRLKRGQGQGGAKRETVVAAILSSNGSNSSSSGSRGSSNSGRPTDFPGEGSPLELITAIPFLSAPAATAIPIHPYDTDDDNDNPSSSHLAAATTDSDHSHGRQRNVSHQSNSSGDADSLALTPHSSEAARRGVSESFVSSDSNSNSDNSSNASGSGDSGRRGFIAAAGGASITAVAAVTDGRYHSHGIASSGNSNNSKNNIPLFVSTSTSTSSSSSNDAAVGDYDGSSTTMVEGTTVQAMKTSGKDESGRRTVVEVTATGLELGGDGNNGTAKFAVASASLLPLPPPQTVTSSTSLTSQPVLSARVQGVDDDTDAAGEKPPPAQLNSGTSFKQLQYEMQRLRHQQQYLQTPEEQLAQAATAAGTSAGGGGGGASSFGSGGVGVGVGAMGISAASISGSHKAAGGQGPGSYRPNLHLEMSSLANQASMQRCGS